MNQTNTMPNKTSDSKKKNDGYYAIVFRRFLKNKAATLGMIIILILLFCSFFPDLIAPYDFDEQIRGQNFQSPSSQHLFGTDKFGRDIFSRVVHGTKYSLLVGFVAMSIALILGGSLGVLAAFYGKKTDNIIMRFMDVLMSIPSLLLAISIAAALGTGVVNLMIAVGLGKMPSFARVARASVLTVKDEDYVEAARAIGASDLRLMKRHILPNSLAPIIVQATLGVADAILIAAALSFIGLGVAPPTPEWGAMLSAGREYIRDYWFVVVFPGLAIMLTIFALNLMGDGLRDALDPRLKS